MRPQAVVVVVVAAAALVIAAVGWVPWEWLPGGPVEPVAARDLFSAAEIARGEQVGGALRHLGWGSLAVSTLTLVILGLTPGGRWLMRRLPGGWFVASLLGVLALLIIVRIVTLPFVIRGRSIRLAEGLTTQGWDGWARDLMVSLGVEWVFTGVAVVVLLGLMRRSPRRWPFWAAGTLAGLVVLGSFVYPVVVEPLFHRFESMPAGELRTGIEAVAEREGVALDDVLVADASRRTTTLNAWVSGFGATRRMVLYDTLVDSVPADQILVIVGHELGHAKHHDVLLGTVLSAGGAALGVGVLGLILPWRREGAQGTGDERVLVPLLVVLIALAGLVAAPVQNRVGRAMEARADVASLSATDDIDAFTAMHRELVLRAKADPTPPRWAQVWFGTHPTAVQRVGLARAWHERGRPSD